MVRLMAVVVLMGCGARPDARLLLHGAPSVGEQLTQWQPAKRRWAVGQAVAVTREVQHPKGAKAWVGYLVDVESSPEAPSWVEGLGVAGQLSGELGQLEALGPLR